MNDHINPRECAGLLFCIRIKEVRSVDLKKDGEKEIGERFNNLHYSAVAQILIRLQKKLSADKQLAKTVIEVDKLFNKLKI